MFARISAWLERGNQPGRARRRIFTLVILWLIGVATLAAWRVEAGKTLDLFKVSVDALWWFVAVYVGDKAIQGATTAWSAWRGGAAVPATASQNSTTPRQP